MFVALIAITLNVNAQVKSTNLHDLHSQNQLKATSITEAAIPILSAIDVNAKPNNGFLANNQLVALKTAYEGVPLDGMVFTPIAYEPHSGALFTISCRRQGTEQAGETRQIISISHSTDLGTTWASDTISDTVQTGDKLPYLLYPSISATNSKSNAFNDVQIAYRLVNGKLNTSTGFINFTNSTWGFTTPEKIKNADKKSRTTTVEQWYPWLGSDLTNSFNGGIHAHAGVINDNAYAFFYGHTYPAEGTTTITHDAIVALNITDAATGEADEIIGNGVGRNINELEKYYGGESTNGSYKSTYGLDYDNAGNVYMFNTNLDVTSFQAPDNSMKYRRYPRVYKAKVDELGNTDAFQMIDELDSNVIKDFLDGLGAVVDKGYSFQEYYKNFSFVVTGTDEYSFIAVLWYMSKNEQNEDEGRLTLAEFAKADGEWKGREIQKLNFLSFSDDTSPNKYVRTPFVCSIDSTLKSNGAYKVKVENSAHELELARTADGQYLVAKFINTDTNHMITLPESMDFRFIYDDIDENGITTHDTCTSTDTKFPYNQVLISYRAIDGNTWSTPMSVVDNDQICPHGTTMPKILPSIDKVPVFFGLGQDLSESQNPSPRTQYINSLPTTISTACGDRWQSGYLVLGGTNSIKEGAPSNVFMLSNAYPNPANNTVRFDFSLSTPAYTTLTITNALGQPVAEIVNSYLDAREHYVDQNIESLPVGVYYYTLRSGSKVETRMFNVVR